MVQAETAGIAILPHREGAEAIILVDAVEFDGKCGEVRIFSGDQTGTDRTQPLSMHQVGVRDLVSLLKLQSSYLPVIILVGIKPKEISLSTDISPEVARGISEAARVVLEEMDHLESACH